MAWPTNPRPAKCLLVLRDQVDARWPVRDKSSDGMLASVQHHAANPTSDHEANAAGVVTAIDITKDLVHGLDSRVVAQALLDSRDPRIKYVISNGQICSSKVSPWVWRPYSGADDHSHHFHLSVDADPAQYDDTRPWKFGTAVKAEVPPPGTFRLTGRENIIATEFGGVGDEQPSAYADVAVGWPDLPGVALPFRFTGTRPRVRVYRQDEAVTWAVVCEIVDVGPWNTNDPYWQISARPQAESGVDMHGRRTNKAGIDLTFAAMNALHVPGPVGMRSAIVSWEFITAAQPAPIPTPLPTKEPPMDLFKFLPLLMRILQILPQILDAQKSGTSIFTLLQKFAPDVIGILTGIGGSLFPELPAGSQAQAGGLMMDPVKVRLIQGQINTLGLANPPLIVDGSYGQMTKAAVTAFQIAHNVTPADGWAGDVTTAALQTEINKLKPADKPVLIGAAVAGTAAAQPF